MKKILTMAVGLLTLIAMFAVVAAARSGDGEDARTATAAASGEATAATEEGGDDHDGEDERLRRWSFHKDVDRAEGLGFSKEETFPADRIPALREWFEAREDDGDASYESPSQLLDELVADGVVTQEQADALRARMEAEAERHLGKLAEMGVIDAEQIPAIIDWLEERMASLKDLDDPSDLLAEMVTDGVVTQEQADSFTELLGEYEGREHRHGRHHRHSGGDRLFSKLAAEGIISEDQLPAITAWIMEQEPGRVNPAEMLASMVEDGVITQEQADAITELFAQWEEMKGDRYGHHHGADDDSAHGDAEEADDDSADAGASLSI